MSTYFIYRRRCEKDIETLCGAKGHLSTLREENESMLAQLSSLASGYATAIRLEDSASFEAQVKSIAAQNDSGIAEIESAINARIATLETEVARYLDLERKEQEADES